MGNLALYRKYRSLTFDTVVGQEHITNALKTQVDTGRISHAYIFTGTRGTGKTSCAKILARAVNCKNPKGGNPCNECDACKSALSDSAMDILEIDAASNNGVDNMRQLRDECVYSPTALKMRVYIIDEVHMLSAGAWAAMLKILEEPPAHVLFILATTEIHKVPVTILSRCQRYDFRRIDQKTIAEHLSTISYKENIEIEPEALALIARLGDGSMRDAISLFERACATGGTLDYNAVTNALGIPNNDTMLSMFKAVVAHDSAEALACFDAAYDDGRDTISFFDSFLSVLRDVYMQKAIGKNKVISITSSLMADEIKSVAGLVNSDTLDYYIDTISDTLARLTRTAIRRIDAEVCILKLCRISHKKPQITDVADAELDDDAPPFDMPKAVKTAVSKPRSTDEKVLETQHEEEPKLAPLSEQIQKQPTVSSNVSDADFKTQFIKALAGKVNVAVRTYLEQSEITKVGNNILVVVDTANLPFIHRDSVLTAFNDVAKSFGQTGVKVTDKKAESQKVEEKPMDGMDDLFASKEKFGI